MNLVGFIIRIRIGCYVNKTHKDYSNNGKGKVRFHPVAGHKGPERE